MTTRHARPEDARAIAAIHVRAWQAANALYVAPEHWRRGIGHHLVCEGVRHLSGSGFIDVTLWVLSDNGRARAFYRSHGFALDAGIEKMVELGGAELLEIRLRNHIRG